MNIQKYLFITFSLMLISCGGGSEPISTTLNGSVAGLDGTLVLEANDGEKFTIKDNGSFNFKTLLKSETTYEIRVKEEPCPQRCNLDKSTAIIPQDGKIELKISCGDKQWDLPTTISDFISFPDAETTYYSAALNKVGDILLTWSQDNTEINSKVFKKEFINRSWINPKDFNDQINPSSSGGYAVDGDLNSDGQAYITWIQNNGSFDQSYLDQRLDYIWIPPTILNPFSFSQTNISDDDGNQPIVRINESGQGFIAWIQYDISGKRRIFVGDLNSGVWIWPTAISQYFNFAGNNDVKSLDGVISENGDKIIVWQQSNGTNTQIFRSENRNNTGWTDITSLDDNISPNGTDAINPKVTIDGNGNTIIVWQQDDDSTSPDSQIFKSEYRKDNLGVWTWNDPNNLSDNLSAYGDNDAILPTVAINDQAYAIIVWVESDGSDNQSHMSLYSPITKTWEASKKISPSGTNTTSPIVRMDNRNNAIIGWRQESIEGSGVFHLLKAESKNVSGDVWEYPTDPSDQISPGSSEATLPVISMKECRSSIVWTQIVNGENQLFIANYR